MHTAIFDKTSQSRLGDWNSNAIPTHQRNPRTGLDDFGPKQFLTILLNAYSNFRQNLKRNPNPAKRNQPTRTQSQPSQRNPRTVLPYAMHTAIFDKASNAIPTKPAEINYNPSPIRSTPEQILMICRMQCIQQFSTKPQSQSQQSQQKSTTIPAQSEEPLNRF